MSDNYLSLFEFIKVDLCHSFHSLTRHVVQMGMRQKTEESLQKLD